MGITSNIFMFCFVFIVDFKCVHLSFLVLFNKILKKIFFKYFYYSIFFSRYRLFKYLKIIARGNLKWQTDGTMAMRHELTSQVTITALTRPCLTWRSTTCFLMVNTSPLHFDFYFFFFLIRFPTTAKKLIEFFFN